MKMEVDAGFAANLKKTQKRGDRNTGKSARRTTKYMRIGASSARRLSLISICMYIS
jgi:hypothetical protein